MPNERQRKIITKNIILDRNRLRNFMQLKTAWINNEWNELSVLIFIIQKQ